MNKRTDWCPKHGVAHGFCVEPIKTTSDYSHIEDPDYVEPETVTTTTLTFLEPKRFDPYEALDEILELSPLAGVRRNVRCLRAYITGMER